MSICSDEFASLIVKHISDARNGDFCDQCKDGKACSTCSYTGSLLDVLVEVKHQHGKKRYYMELCEWCYGLCRLAVRDADLADKALAE